MLIENYEQLEIWCGGVVFVVVFPNNIITGVEKAKFKTNLTSEHNYKIVLSNYTDLIFIHGM